ncbi:MAG: VWA domain-containing protein, partial [Gemmatimonadetes bacterium]|nr:VWA domain-containing protein [Gemmatimonadota bacterium]
MFEFLFKYRPVVFERGELSLALPAWVFLLTVFLVSIMVVVALGYRAVGPTVTRRDRRVLTILRVVAFSILLFLLFRPVLLVSTVVPRRNFVAVLLDDSRSMRVADEDESTRAQRIVDWFSSEAVDSLATTAATMERLEEDGGALRRALEERFRLRLYGFDSDATRIGGPEMLAFDGDRTSLGDALSRVGQEMSGLPLSGIVVVSDGADTDDEAAVPLSEALLAVRASGVPVYTIGLGAERIAPDIEVRRIELPRRALEGTTVVADVIVSHAGLAGRSVRLDVEDDGRIVG